jgi:gliding motility-associated-like protein
MKNWNTHLLVWFLLVFSTPLFSQATITLTVTGGNATTTCTDIFGAPDPLWSVNVQNQGWVNYPAQGPCFTALPNVQYTQTYTCLSDAPATIQVCFRAFENDGLGICAVDPSCEEIICQTFNIPASPGTVSYTLALPSGLSSGGSVQFDINASGTGALPNDTVCGAVDAGVLGLGDTWGDLTLSNYNNYCATGIGEPSPSDYGATWYNNNGMWFQFTTGPVAPPYVRIRAVTDPEGLGDDFNIQLALWTTDNGACDGAFSLVANSFVNGNWDETLTATCLQANTTYFVLVDGTADSPPELFGYFGIEIAVWDVQNVGDLPCEALALGTVPENGSIAPPDLYTNRCATAGGEPTPSAFFPDKTVWFSFQPPLSGHVLIDLQSNSLDAVNIQLALFQSSDNTCTGTFSEVDYSYSATSFNESMEVSCLDPSQTYWLLVDGATNNRDGIFTISITDEGDDTPITNQVFVLCAGGSVTVGTTTYTITGLYTDTLLLPGGCDSVVITDLTVLSALILDVTNVGMASGLGNLDGSALAVGTGGLPPYTFSWSGGQTTAQVNDLEGGASVCVTITDSNNCVDDTCFTVPYFTFIAPTVTGDSLDCAGDLDGEFSFSAVGGQPPYTYTWNNSDNTLSGGGTVAAAGDLVNVAGLPADTYTLTIADGMIDTTVNVVIWEPEPLSVQVIQQANASCFSFCDGALQIAVQGGTPAYQFTWSNGATADQLADLCAGSYTVTITDANGCALVQTYTITQPVEFIATIQVVQHVSCFQGADGQLTVTATGGTAVVWDWSNGGQTATISGLTASTYTVSVTNQDGCQDMATATVTQPNAPVTASIQIQEEISCFGAGDGVLAAIAGGPGLSFTYVWSNGATGATASNLGPGAYEVTISNELGCTATAQANLSQPTEIVAAIQAVDITCETEAIGGSIHVVEVNGGAGPYLYSLDGSVFLSDTAFNGLSAGNYTVYVADATGCEKAYPATVLPPPVLTVDLGPDQQVQLGDPVNLFANLNSTDAVFEWTNTTLGALDCLDASCQDISILPTESGQVVVMAFDTLTRCRATDSILVEVIKDRRLFIPNVFSPNFDGVNDFFTIFGKKGVEQIALFRIFDRNGALVFEARGIQPGDETRGWDGAFNERPAPQGVYTFFAEVHFIDQEVQVVKGDVALVR